MPEGAAIAMASCTVDVACFMLEGRRLLRLEREAADGATELPWRGLATRARLVATASAVLRESLGGEAPWTAQLGAYDSGDVHPSRAPLTVAYVAVVPVRTPVPRGHAWVSASDVDDLTARQARIVLDALALLRERASTDPIPFHLLAPRFTLAELQVAYEVLLRRRLHKASFRRALRTTNLIAETDEHRSIGRGRPALLYRHAPRRASSRRPSLPFDPRG